MNTPEITAKDKSTETPAFPHHLAPAPTPLEAAERQYAERPTGAPHWRPEDGDFT
jgi:hypothetical protein